jgi:hypothetical protein
MITKFFDLQEDSNPSNGAEITDVSQLLEIIDGLLERPPFICELVGDNGFGLSFGIGRPIGCAQYRSTDGRPPYFVTTSGDADIAEDEFEFLMGDTLTPISGRYCIKFDLLKEVAAHFQETGQRSTLVEWEEI